MDDPDRRRCRPGSARGGQTWTQFLTTQAKDILACDFLHADTIGLTCFYVLFLMEIETRRVHILGATTNPIGEWVTQQARNLMLDLGGRVAQFRFLIRDRDSKYIAAFDEVFTTEGIEILRTPPQAPRERVRGAVIRTVRRECLDRMLIYNERHLLACGCQKVSLHGATSAASWPAAGRRWTTPPAPPWSPTTCSPTTIG